MSQVVGSNATVKVDDARAEQLKGLDHMFGLVAGAKLPLIQALITGVVLGMLVLVIAWVGGWRAPWKWGIVTLVVSEALYWGLYLWRWFDLTKLENWTGLDINQDGAVGRRELMVVRVELAKSTNSGGREVKFIDLPGSPEQLGRLAKGLLRGVPFAERHWVGKGGAFSSSEFRELRAEMVRRGLIEPVSDKDNRVGFKLTDEEHGGGRAVMERILEQMGEQGVSA